MRAELNKEMNQKIEEILAAISELRAGTEKEIEELRIKYLGKKGEVKALFEDFRKELHEKKREFGQKLNVLKNAVQAKIYSIMDSISETGSVKS